MDRGLSGSEEAEKDEAPLTELCVLSPTSRSSVHSNVGLGCRPCAFLEDCGGVFSDFDCLGDCCNDPDGCTIACPRSARFAEVVQDCGGWNRRVPTLKQTLLGVPLPFYVPCIQNGYQRIEPLQIAIAAIPTFIVTSRTRRKRF